ncbi:MAG: hypothetical protein QW487_00025 [Candidatus Bathyarchaeia archaeon]
MPELIVDYHKLKTPIDHPNQSITQAKLAVELWNALEKIANKGVANGYAELDANALIPTSKIPDLTRSKITDFFYSPFWANIPDKPSSFTPSAHQSSHRSGGSDALPWGSGGGLDVDLLDGAHKDWIRDWVNILNKPSSFPPSAHASSHAPGGSDSLSSYYLVGLKKYAEVSVSSDTTVLDVTGLNINSHKFYWVICKFKNPLTSSVTYYMFIEGDTNQANYQHRYLYGDGSTVYTGQNNSATLCDTSASVAAIVFAVLQLDPDNCPRFNTLQSSHAVLGHTRSVRKTATVTNITSLKFQASSTNGIGAGSRILIYGAAS